MKNSLVPNDFTCEFCQSFKDELTLYKFYQTNRRKGDTSQHIRSGQHYPNIKPEASQEIKVQPNISYEYTCKNPQKNSSKPNSGTSK